MYSGYLSTPGSQRSSVAPEYTRRSPSPSPSSTSSKDTPERTNSRMLTRRPVSGQSIASLQQQHHIMATQQPQQMSPTLHHSTSSSALSVRSMSTSRIDDDDVGSEENTASVESKIAKEGWIFKKNSLMVMNRSWFFGPDLLCDWFICFVSHAYSNGNPTTRWRNMEMLSSLEVWIYIKTQR